MGAKPKAGGGGSMVTILLSIVVVAAVAMYFLDPAMLQNIVTTIARWLRLGH